MPISAFWQATELLTVENGHLGQRVFHPRSHHREPSIVEAFGRSDPSSASLLLHHYAKPDTWNGRNVILVHGASRNALYFLDPHEDGSGRDPLPEALRRAGHQVYAVSFAHNQDDNWWWCEALNEAILTVSSRTGQPVALIGHSKGGVAVRLAVSDWRPDPACQRRLGHLVSDALFVGTPLGGVDFFYRYPAVNFAFSSDSDQPVFNWPTPWHEMKVNQQWMPLPMAYTGKDNFYRGQAQLLQRWRDVYPLPGLDPLEEMTYEGGENESGRCHGIDRAIAGSGNLIGQLRQHPFPPHLRVGLLAGASPTMPGVMNERSGPSDGIIFVQSALEIGPGAQVVGMKTLPVHHKALIAEPSSQTAIIEMLEATQPLTSEQIESCRADGVALGERLCDQAAANDSRWGARV